MGVLTRREALLRTIGCAAAGVMPLRPAAAFAAPMYEPLRGVDIDRALATKVEAREIPGVVAMAANGERLLYEGAFGFRQLRAAHRPVTLRQLLSHTSGFSYPLWDESVVRYLRVAHQHKDLPRRPLLFEPGMGWAYGGSLDNVGRMVEIASGQPLDRYFRDHITGPLGMNDTGFSLSEKQRAREASLHVRETSGRLVPQPLEKQVPQSSFSGGGGIYSSAPDYLTLLQALLNGGSLRGAEILRPGTVALMAENQIGNLEAGHMKTTNPALSNDVDFFPGKRLRWGLGHMINLDPVTDGRKAGSLTWAGLFNTYYWIDPSMRVAGVIMMQILPFADGHALSAYRDFERGICHAMRQA